MATRRSSPHSQFEDVAWEVGVSGPAPEYSHLLHGEAGSEDYVASLEKCAERRVAHDPDTRRLVFVHTRSGRPYYRVDPRLQPSDPEDDAFVHGAEVDYYRSALRQTRGRVWAASIAVVALPAVTAFAMGLFASPLLTLLSLGALADDPFPGAFPAVAALLVLVVFFRMGISVYRGSLERGLLAATSALATALVADRGTPESSDRRRMQVLARRER